MTTEQTITTKAVWYRYRTLLTLLCGAAVIALFGSIRFSDDTGVHPDIFFLNKLEWKHRADIVIAGDSRAYFGVSPEELATSLNGSPRVLNFGFNALKYDQDYLDALFDVIDLKSPKRKMILLGISPNSVSTTHSEKFPCGYKTAKKTLREMNVLERELRHILTFFSSMEPKDLIYGLFPSGKKKRLFRHYHENGWVDGKRVPEQPGRRVGHYRESVSRKRHMDEEKLDMLIRFATKCREAGIDVVAFRPPTCKGLVEAENELTDYMELDVPEYLKKGGVTWLDLDQSGYHSFDDIHLSGVGARGLSTDLGVLLNNHAQKHPDE